MNHDRGLWIPGLRQEAHPGMTMVILFLASRLQLSQDFSMPVPTHIFDPPFNIIRSSHAVLDVTNLETSGAFYENTIGLHVEDQDDGAVYLRGSEEHQHHSLVLRKAVIPDCARLGFKVGNESDLDKAARVLSPRTASLTVLSNSRSRAAPCNSPIRSASSSNSTPRWSGGRICCAATISTRAATRSGSTISMYSPPRCRTPSTFTPGLVSASPNMARKTARTAASRRPGCTARATCTILRSPTARARACTTSPIGCRPR